MLVTTPSATGRAHGHFSTLLHPSMSLVTMAAMALLAFHPNPHLVLHQLLYRIEANDNTHMGTNEELGEII